ncbi:carbon-nitrogen hydrolase family protein [Pseudomonas sp. 2FG]|uniref:carbon-nitrogen hydrolase family protein n=1 Tax=Pseudomonas sp. 2FG TaxID=2502191 RepID=UPI0010F86118|nr:carbon-nitrogen hydrolase family protein [Pseudomonas sp. 2FG]
MRHLHIAALQTASVSHDVDASWARFASQAHQVRQLFPQVQLLMLPELVLSGSAPLLQAEAGWMEHVAEPLDGPQVQRLCGLARELGLWLQPGSLFERADDGQIYNTALLISPAGEIAARYRKIFPWQPYETSTPGDQFVVCDLPGIGRVGLAICYDNSFPEVARQLAWLGAEVILVPTLTGTRDREMECVCARANAFCNQLYVVNLNAASPLGVGESLIVDPEGLVRQKAGAGEEILVDCLDLEQVARVRQHGSAGVSRPWQQLQRYAGRLALPMYGGHLQAMPDA